MKYVSGKYTSAELRATTQAVEAWIVDEFTSRGAITNAVEQSDMSRRLQEVTFGKNIVRFDDQGNPSIMVVIPQMRYSDCGLTADNDPVHPAFVVGGNSKPQIEISKYQNIVVGSGTEARALSLRLLDPRASINWDDAKAACEAKGPGWHLMTNAEWAAIALWCKANGLQPRGNNNYGKDILAAYERGIETTNSGGQTNRVATGSGSASWSHDGTPNGIYDLNGNVWEWVQGLKIIDGVAYVMIDNNFTDNESDWVNTGVDITSGMTSGNRILTMREGAIPNTPSMDWSTLAIPATSSESGSADYGYDAYWFNAEGERLPLRGGSWSNGASAGVFALHLNRARSDSGASFGFRSAFVI